MQIRDRIKGLVRVPASKVRMHPQNWRKHPDAQRETLRELFGEVGIAAAGIARKLKDGTYMLIDGHLRRDELEKANAKIPLLVLDVTEAEADKLLLAMDPLASMAEQDQENLKALLKKVKTKGKAIASLYSSLGKGLFNAKDLSIEYDGEEPEEDDGEMRGSDAPVSDSHVRMVQLFLDTKTLPLFTENVSFLADKLGTKNATETVMKALEKLVRIMKKGGKK